MGTIEPSLQPAAGKMRTYTAAERVADGSIHAIGVGASVLGVAALMIAARNLPASSIASLAIYAAIYIKIAGTYTPFAAIKMGDAAGIALLATVWAITAFGATAKLLWPGRLVRTSYVLYLAQGWAIVAAFGPFASTVSDRVLVLLVVGGSLYTFGVVFHLWERLRYHNAIWHALVVAASACHFAAIVDAVGLTGGA
jgi:hemolysin III